MSNKSNSSFSNFGTVSYELKNKMIPQSEAKKLKKQINKNSKSKVEEKSSIKINKYKNYIGLDKTIINDNNIKLLNTNLKGTELFKESKKYNDIDITIVKNILEKNDIEWMLDKEYGLLIKKIINEDKMNQLELLIIITEDCIEKDFPRIILKNKECYVIKVLFQLLFTNDIIDENIYYEWLDYIEAKYENDNHIKNKLLIQTSEFYNILKTVFEEEEDNSIELDENLKINNKLDEEEEKEDE